MSVITLYPCQSCGSAPAAADDDRCSECRARDAALDPIYDAVDRLAVAADRFRDEVILATGLEHRRRRPNVPAARQRYIVAHRALLVAATETLARL